jgi:ankyrin repeat protein
MRSSKRRHLIALALAFAALALPLSHAGATDRAWSWQNLEASVAAQRERAQTDAARAIKASNFGLILVGPFGLPIGTSCYTPYGRPNKVLSEWRMGDVITPEFARETAYAQEYNTAIVESAAYPDADICRAQLPGDPRVDRGPPLVNRAARTVVRPIMTLHEAARRGDAQDIRTFLAKTPVDTPDGNSMTALAWAAARGNVPAIQVLLEHGASVGRSGEGAHSSAIYWAVATGRANILKLLVRQSSEARPKTWPASYLIAAANSGKPEVLQILMDDLYERPDNDRIFDRGMPEQEILKLLLARHVTGFADSLLFRSLENHDAETLRLDLISMAIAYGANPNTTRRYGETPLGLASHGFHEGSIEASDLLLKAGAAVNQPSEERPLMPRRPVWNAVNTMLLGTSDETCLRARAIFERLVAAGADLRLLDENSKPPVWFLVTPYRRHPEQIEAQPELAKLLPMLVASGMDVNATWQGRTVLPLVEQQLGRDTPIAVVLRTLGAK